jgi:hypothetical protein
MKANQYFGGTHQPHLQGQRINQARNQHEAGSKQIYEMTVDFHWTTWLELFITTIVRTSNPTLFLHC